MLSRLRAVASSADKADPKATKTQPKSDSRTSSTRTTVTSSPSRGTGSPRSGTPGLSIGSRQDLLLFRSPSSDSGCSDVYLQRGRPRANCDYENIEFPPPPPPIADAGKADIGAGITMLDPSQESLPPPPPSCPSSLASTPDTTRRWGRTDRRLPPDPPPRSQGSSVADWQSTGSIVETGDSDANLSVCWQDMVSVEAFVELVRKRDVPRLQQVLRSHAYDLDSQDEEGKTALHHALVHGVVEGDVEIAHLLVNCGADVNIKDETAHRESAIHVALRLGHLDAIKLLLQAPSFDVIRCDAFQRSKMFPEACTIEDIYNLPPADSEDTLTKRRSFGDQYMLFVRHNTRDYMENNFPPGRESIRDMIIVQDEAVPPLHDLLHHIDYAQLTSLFIVDCRLQLDDKDLFRNLNIRTLVLSHTHLRRLPKSLFNMDSLELLKVDRNNLEEIPVEIGNLRNLKSFCCDTQRPRLRNMPHSITKLEHLEVLSFNNNRIDNIAWVVALPNLRVLRCARNRLTRLPNQLVNLRELAVLDVSHNRLEYIPPSFVDVLSRLYRFDYFNLTLKPKHISRDKAQLMAYLELENFLVQNTVRRNVRDISIAVVGESHSGKSTLIEALKNDKGICKNEVPQESAFEIHQFDMHSAEQSSYISTIVLANDILDNFSRNINVDLFLLVVDLTSLELQNGSQHLFARHINRMQMWLQALYENSPDTPVLLVGTHAELVKSMSFSDIWHVLEGFLDQGRSHHTKRFTDSRQSNCLLCAPKSLAVRHVMAKSKSGSAGFVDLSFPHGEPVMNGHVSTGEPPPPGKFRFPHVVGYYEIDSKKNLPKDAKKSNVSIEQLKGAILRLTAVSPDDGIPPNWLHLVRHMATIVDEAPDLPCLPYDEVISLARSFDISPADVPFMLQYFHQRGKMVYFGNDDLLSKMVVINPTWFIQVLTKVLEGLESSKHSITELLELLQDKDLDRQLHKAGALSLSSADWLLAALRRLDICVPYLETNQEKLYLLPNLLEVGPPSLDVWPDLPEWDEKQITCDFALRCLKPCLFMDLILRCNREGRRVMEIVAEPAPVFLAHHIVFYTSVDVGGCEDCYAIRRRLRVRHKNDDEDEVQDDILHKVHIQLHPNMDALRIAVRGVSPCCTMKSILNFLELYLDDIPEEDGDSLSDRTSISSHALSSASRSASVSSDRGSLSGSDSSEKDADERQCFLLCPKCVLLRHVNPERISYQTISPKRKAICSRWHNLGSWTRAVTGDYRFTNDFMVSSTLSALPEYEHPRLVMVLPPSTTVSSKDWYMFSRTKFLEGFEVHFLCEFTGYWHMTEDTGFRLNQSSQFIRRVGNMIPSILSMALPMVQVANGVHEHGQNGRLLAPVVSELIKMYDYLRNVDSHIADPYVWMVKNKDRVVTMLTKVLANASDGFPDLYFKVGNAIHADMVFQSASTANRYELAKFLRIESSSGRFGSLRPLYVGREIRWLCDHHYEELRSMPSK